MCGEGKLIHIIKVLLNALFQYAYSNARNHNALFSDCTAAK